MISVSVTILTEDDSLQQRRRRILAKLFDILSFGQFLEDTPFAPLGLGPWGVWRFYTPFAPLGLRFLASACIFLKA